jgi:hypothetical protein
MQSSKTPASSEAQPLDFTKLFTMDEHVIVHNDPALRRGCLVHPEQVIDLTVDEDEDGEEDAREVSWLKYSHG